MSDWIIPKACLRRLIISAGAIRVSGPLLSEVHDLVEATLDRALYDITTRLSVVKRKTINTDDVFHIFPSATYATVRPKIETSTQRMARNVAKNGPDVVYIPRAVFSRMFGNAVKVQEKRTHHITKKAMAALHNAVENEVRELLTKAVAVATAAKRPTVMVNDLKTVQQMMGFDMSSIKCA